MVVITPCDGIETRKAYRGKGELPTYIRLNREKSIYDEARLRLVSANFSAQQSKSGHYCLWLTEQCTHRRERTRAEGTGTIVLNIEQ